MKSENNSLKTLEQKALTAFREGRLEECIRTYDSARKAYDAEGNESMAAEMANNMSVALLKVGRHQQALDLVQGTPERFLTRGDLSRAAHAFGNLGSALEACGDIAGAMTAYRQAADLFVQLGDTDKHAFTLQALSRLQIRQGQPLEAVATMQAGLEELPHPSIRNRLIRRLLRIPFRLFGR